MADQVKALSVVDQNKKQIVSIVQAENFKTQLAAALMSRLPLDYVVRSAIATINSNPKIQECTPLSTAASILLLAQAGLAPEPWKGHGYLVPRSMKTSRKGQPDKWEMVCTALIGYRGYLNLAYRSPEVAKAIAHPVYEGDIFDFDQVAGTVVHKPWVRPETNREKRGKILGAYALVKMKNGESLAEWMTTEDIEATRSRSAASDNGPWKTDYAEMARKTPFRRLFKWIPDADLQRIAALEEASDFGNMQVTLDAQTGEIITQVLEVSEQNQQQPQAIQMPKRQEQITSGGTQTITTEPITVTTTPGTVIIGNTTTIAEDAQITYTETEEENGQPKDYGFGASPVTQEEPETATAAVDVPTGEDLFAAKAEQTTPVPAANKDKAKIGEGRAKRIRAIAFSKKTRTEEDYKELMAAFKITNLADYPMDRHKELESWAEGK
jgi:recombination protein RecT